MKVTVSKSLANGQLIITRTVELDKNFVALDDLVEYLTVLETGKTAEGRRAP